MADFVTLTCPTCGGKLQITNDVERFACGYCGNEHIVKRSGGIVSLSPVVEGLSKVQAGVDKTASELAIVRLNGEIGQISSQLNQLLSDRTAETFRETGVICFILAVLVFPAILAAPGNLALWAGVLILAVFLGYVGMIRLREAKSMSARKRSELERVQLAVQQRNLELARHREVVGHK
jgi:hypothetical protein